MKQKRINIITMGCSKNLVDSERLAYQFSCLNYCLVLDQEIEPSDIVVVNTCGFIADAKEESIQTILQLTEMKEKGIIEQIYVIGCLSERYKEVLKKEIPLVDGYLGKFDWKNLLSCFGHKFNEEKKDRRIISTPSHYAYIKIAEGCDRHCAYCAIPLMTGKYISRPIEDILSEVKCLVAQGVKEFQVIAQEITFYGLDLYHRPSIAELIRRMAKINGVEWIRLHYAYPSDFPSDLLDVIRETPNVCKYLDLALQHISTPILERMRRRVTKEETISLIKEIRNKVPGICLRTTLMVGFPGETEADFNELLDFVRWARFERMGAFMYSEEDGTYAAQKYSDDIPQEVKQQRLDKLMAVQQIISAEIAEARKDQVLRVMIDKKEGEWFIGRTEYDSPDVDGEVLIHHSNGKLNIGSFYQVKITSSDEFDLYGTVEKCDVQR